MIGMPQLMALPKRLFTHFNIIVNNRKVCDLAYALANLLRKSFYS